jgi:hypothetical protein
MPKATNNKNIDEKFDDAIFNLDSARDLQLLVDNLHSNCNEDPRIKTSSLNKKPGRPAKIPSTKATSKKIAPSAPSQAPDAMDSNGFIVKLVISLLHKIDLLNKKIDKLSTYEDRVEENESKIIELESKLHSKDNDILELQLSVDNLEQEQRSNSIVLSGPSIQQFNAMKNDNRHRHEDCSNFLQGIMNVNIHPREIQSATKMGAKTNSLLIKFNSKSSKINIFKNLKNVQSKSLYASDFLTARRSKLLYDLRQLRGPSEYSKFSICVRNGNPYVVFKQENEWIKILTNDHIRNLQTKLNSM